MEALARNHNERTVSGTRPRSAAETQGIPAEGASASSRAASPRDASPRDASPRDASPRDASPSDRPQDPVGLALGLARQIDDLLQAWDGQGGDPNAYRLQLTRALALGLVDSLADLAQWADAQWADKNRAIAAP